MDFRLNSEFTDRGDQQKAIKYLADNIKRSNKSKQVLLGVTGSGKTYTMARVIEETNLPTIVITHNKTLTAQLYSEFKSFFPDNAIEYFVSYYDYYQPEAYIPHSDTYIEKDASINSRIEQLRLKATSSLLSRKDVIIVASVSSIYGLGNPLEWENMMVQISLSDHCERSKLAAMLTDIRYTRNDIEFKRGTFRIRGSVFDIYPAYNSKEAIRVKFDNDTISEIYSFEPISAKKIAPYNNYIFYPATHFVTSRSNLEKAIVNIRKELKGQLAFLKKKDKLLEAQRLEMRTEYDIEMLREIGYCNGIENYSRIISDREPGSTPYCLLHYFPEKYLTIIDESHVTLPQIRGMYAGDRSRKETLVAHGFRLPSALDNRPLKYPEFESMNDEIIYVSATPSEYELEVSNGHVVEQIIRPTFLVDPKIDIRPVKNQVEDLMKELTHCIKNGNRALVTTLTKKMSEDLADYLKSNQFKVRYLHSEVKTLERIEIIRDLRKGVFDCLVGVNLLREGLDIPEVSLVAILDADREGFLRSETSLIQVSGRASRNIDGRVVMYADKITGSMQRAIEKMSIRRDKQIKFNKEHNIKPKSILKAIRDDQEFEYEKKAESFEYIIDNIWDNIDGPIDKNIIKEMERDMLEAADALEFELAAAIRDKIDELKQRRYKKNSKKNS